MPLDHKERKRTTDKRQEGGKSTDGAVRSARNPSSDKSGSETRSQPDA